MAVKFIPYEKLSKKEKKKLNSIMRNNWGGVKPATKIIDTDKRTYSRKVKFKRCAGDFSED